MSEDHSRSDPTTSSPQPSKAEAAAENQGKSNNEVKFQGYRSSASSSVNVISKLEPGLEKLQKIGRAVVAQVRSRLPYSIAGKLSDPILIGIILSVAAFLIVIGISWLSSDSSPQVIAQGSDSQGIPSETQTKEEADLSLNPEQSLIAAIQDQVAEVTDAYADGLIQSVEANFRRSLLIVRAGEAWYTLERSRQDQMANELWGRSQQLDFNQLHLIDLDNTLLARSPVVGPSMVILKRAAALEASSPTALPNTP